MPTTAIWAYLERLPGLKAEMRLMMAEATSVPHLKRADRRTLLRQLSEQMAAKRTAPVKRVVSRGQLALMGIGYRKEGHPPSPPGHAGTREDELKSVRR